MNETQLLRICIVVCIAGIISLFFISKTIEAISLEIGAITEEQIGKTVAVSGVIQDVRFSKGITLFTIKDETTAASIHVVIFENRDDLQQGTQAIVSGKVQTYKGELEIIAERIGEI